MSQWVKSNALGGEEGKNPDMIILVWFIHDVITTSQSLTMPVTSSERVQ